MVPPLRRDGGATAWGLAPVRSLAPVPVPLPCPRCGAGPETQASLGAGGGGDEGLRTQEAVLLLHSAKREHQAGGKGQKTRSSSSYLLRNLTRHCKAQSAERHL